MRSENAANYSTRFQGLLDRLFGAKLMLSISCDIATNQSNRLLFISNGSQPTGLNISGVVVPKVHGVNAELNKIF